MRAIAATLLVLPLVSTAADLGHGTVAGLLTRDSHELLASALSFLVICRYWLAHNGMYETVVDYTSVLVWFTFVFLLSIVFLPFPTELIGSADSTDTAAVGLYMSTLLVATAANLGQEWIITRAPELQAADIRGTLSVIPAAVTTAVLGLALALAVTVPAIGLWSLLLLIPVGVSERWISRQFNACHARRRTPRGHRPVRPPVPDRENGTFDSARRPGPSSKLGHGR